MAASKKLNPQQQRERRSRILLAVLGVVFVGVLALEVPKMMGGSGAAAPPAPATTATTTTAAPGTTVPAATPAPVAATTLSAVRYTVSVQPGQLSRFSHFAAKDPFKAPAGTGASSTSATATPPAASTPAAQPKTKTTPAPPVSFSVVSGSKAGKAAAGPLVPAALLQYDGKKHVVALGDTFPAKRPLFRLVSLSKKAIWLQLIGGSFANGKTTLKVLRGHPVTLVNTTAGTRVVVVLVRPTTTHPQPTPSSAG